MRNPLPFALLASFSVACASSEQALSPRTADEAVPSESATSLSDDVSAAVDTTAEAAKTGVYATGAAFILAGNVAVAGTETAGMAVGGLVTGGTEGAARAWEKGARHTRVVARRDARYTVETVDEGANATRDVTEKKP